MSKVVLTDMRSDVRPAPGEGVNGFTRFRALSPLGILVTRSEVALAGMFLWAAFNKLRPPNGPQLFSDSIHAFKLGLPEILFRAATSVTPWIEVLSGLCLLLGIWSRAAATVLSSLLLLFIALLASVLARGLPVECGCFGKMSPFCPEKVSTCNIYQNLVLLALGLLIALTPRHRLVSSSGTA